MGVMTDLSAFSDHLSAVRYEHSAFSGQPL